jgi:hypothetical protein
MSSLYRGLSIDASYQVSVHLAMWFQRRRFKKIDQSETRIASDWSISKKSSLKPLNHIIRSLVGSISGRSFNFYLAKRLQRRFLEIDQ